MSVDTSFALVNWESFLKVHASCDNTERAFVDFEDEILEELSSEAPAGDTMEATDLYDGIRSELDEHLDVCDRCFAVTFWDPQFNEKSGSEEPPVPSDINVVVVDIEQKGQRIYLQSLFSPESARRFAEEWNSIPMDSLLEKVESVYSDSEWEDSFQSAEDFVDYVESWKAVFNEAAEKHRGILIRVG